MPFDFRTFFLIFRLALRDRRPWLRRVVVFALLFLTPAVATLNALCLWLDYVFFPGYRRTQVREPVFILGHPHSGSTLVRRLMTDDPQVAWFSTWELLLPSILQQRLVRLAGVCDRVLLRGRVARVIIPVKKRIFRSVRELHSRSLSGPEDDEFALAFSCLSAAWAGALPYMRELQYLYYLDAANPARRRRAMGFYRACVQRQLYTNTGARFHCSHSPAFSGRVESVVEAFPDARFVVVMRNPLETIPERLERAKRAWQAADCDPERVRDALDGLRRQSYHTYRYPLEVLGRHVNVRWCVVDYEALVASPKAAIEDAYAELGLSISPEFEKQLALEQDRPPAQRVENVDTAREFGPLQDEVREELQELFDAYRWPVD